jgi:hypothetical protein
VACYHPSEVLVELKRTPTPEWVMVPCGKCLGCRTDQARDWAVRITHETVMNPPGYFLTLTYDDESIPSHGSLDPTHPQKWLKRLRRRLGARVSYYLCGEYGETTDRPHYHAVLAGARFLDREEHTIRHGVPVWTSELLSDTWGHGLCELTPVAFGNAMYVAGYVGKKIARRFQEEEYERVDRETGQIIALEREFGRMSLRPALGRTFIEKYWSDVYPRDFVVCDGWPVKPPRYYDKWAADNIPEIFEEVQHQRWLDAENIGDDKLIMKEKIHRAKNALFNKRNIL